MRDERCAWLNLMSFTLQKTLAIWTRISLAFILDASIDIMSVAIRPVSHIVFAKINTKNAPE